MPVTTKRKMNVRLLRQIQKTILTEPRRVNMDTWATGKSNLVVGGRDEWGNGWRTISTPKKAMPPCGTMGCICGWGVAITTKLRGDALENKLDKLASTTELPRGATKLFGLTPSEAGRLFFKDEWPDEFQEQIDRYQFGTKRYAKVVCARIDHFIATKGAE